jgi:hypothetical protein
MLQQTDATLRYLRAKQRELDAELKLGTHSNSSTLRTSACVYKPCILTGRVMKRRAAEQWETGTGIGMMHIAEGVNTTLRRHPLVLVTYQLTVMLLFVLILR